MRKVTTILIALVLIAASILMIVPGTTQAQAVWAPNTAYAVGQLVTYNGLIYKCIQAHTSQVGWEPPNVPALWGLQSGTVAPTTAPTKTNTAGPTATKTNTAVPTKTNTPGGPTATKTPTFVPTNTTPTATANSGKKIIAGYWHGSFDNGTGSIQLANISPKYDIIDVAFAAPNGGANGVMDFTPFSESVAQVKADVITLRGRGKRTLISVGGYVGSTFTLSDTTSMNNFINSMESIISTYGFDGMDLDFEQTVLSLNSGDTDFTAPTSPDIVNTIKAIRTIHDHFGAGFMITYAPETFRVQVGHTNYGGYAGVYLPVIYATQDIMNYLAVQDYNSGPVMGLDGTYWNMGGADFHVAMTEMLLRGFSVAGTSKVFPAIPASKILIGVPAVSSAGNGYVDPTVLEAAFSYLDLGTPDGGSYKILQSGGYPGVRGFMTWSINWDNYSGNPFSNPIRAYLDSLPR